MNEICEASLERIKRRMRELECADRAGADKRTDPRYVLQVEDMLATWELLRDLVWDNRACKNA